MKYETFDAELHLTNGEIITVLDVNSHIIDAYKAQDIVGFARNKHIITGMSGYGWGSNGVLIFRYGETDMTQEIIINTNQIVYAMKINEREIDDRY